LVGDADEADLGPRHSGFDWLAPMSLMGHDRSFSVIILKAVVGIT